MATKVTSKGQVTIPKRVREALGVKPGDRIEFVVEDGRVVLVSAGKPGIAGSYGALGRFRRKAGESEPAMLERVRKEVAHAAVGKSGAARYKRTS